MIGLMLQKNQKELERSIIMKNFLKFFSRKKWKPHLDAYKELRALKFSPQIIDKAIDLMWGDELKDCPHHLAGDNTIIVPVEAVRCFKNAGLEFKDTRVLSASELPPEECYKLRREQGTF